MTNSTEHLSYILTFIGSRKTETASVQALRARYPQWRVQHKVQTHYELQCDQTLSDIEANLPKEWQVRAMTYAEVAPPSLSLTGLAKKLQQLRVHHDQR